MTTDALRLSMEEVLVAVLLEGGPAVRASLVGMMQRAGLSKHALRACVRASEHSLMARNLLDAKAELSEPLRDAARALAHATSSVAYRKRDLAVLYYFGEHGTYEQRVEDRVVHTLRPTDDDREAVVQRGQDFFGIDGGPVADYPPIDLGIDDFAAVKNASNIALIEQRLEGAGVPFVARIELAEDLYAPTYCGEVVHASNAANGRLKPDRGMLVLGGLQRAWLLRASPPDASGQPCVTIVRGTPDAFRSEAAALVA